MLAEFGAGNGKWWSVGEDVIDLKMVKELRKESYRYAAKEIGPLAYHINADHQGVMGF